MPVSLLNSVKYSKADIIHEKGQSIDTEKKLKLSARNLIRRETNAQSFELNIRIEYDEERRHMIGELPGCYPMSRRE